MALLWQSTQVMLSAACRLVADVLAGLLAWRAVLEHLLNIESDDFGGDEMGNGTPPCAARARRSYKDGVMHASRALLACYGIDACAQAPLALAELDGAAGSGAALNDWLLGISGGWEGHEVEAVAAAEASMEEGDEYEGPPGALPLLAVGCGAPRLHTVPTKR
jgi:hypothetical protein